MKTIIVIFLSLQFITNNAFAEELVKMPKLFTHFYHHSNEHRDTKDFFDFLHKHYSGHHETDTHSKNHSDEDSDCQLPFKHCGDCCLNVHSSVIGFVPTILNTDFTFLQIQDSGFMSEDDRIESLDICTIWQPPKIS